MIRFDHWMEHALYGPRGYYTTPRPILGARGDFTTTPKLSPLLAQTLASEIEGPVIELGPGDGTLALAIRESLNFFQRRKLDYHLVEISPPLKKRQQQKLNGKGTWHPDLSTALQATGSHATIISNEFFDAFPVRIFQDENELFLDSDHTEVWLPIEHRPSSTLFEKSWPAGQRLEVAESIHHWYRDQLTHWHHGTMISIDYGGSAEEIYHRRPHGTIRSYLHHTRLYPPETYQNPGRQDITSDVNFDDLKTWGEESGMRSTHYQSLANYLQTDPNGPDGSFKILHQTPA